MTKNRVLSSGDVTRIVSHMNEEHADDLVRYAQAFADVTGVEAARMTDIAAEGFELEVTMDEAVETVWIEFDTPLQTVGEARSALVELAMTAREAAER